MNPARSDRLHDAAREAVTLEDALHYDEPPAWMIPARHSLGAASAHKLAGQPTRSAADVNHALPGGDPRFVSERGSQRRQVAAHQSVVSFGGHGECRAHPRGCLHHRVTPSLRRAEVPA